MVLEIISSLSQLNYSSALIGPNYVLHTRPKQRTRAHSSLERQNKWGLCLKHSSGGGGGALWLVNSLDAPSLGLNTSLSVCSNVINVIVIPLLIEMHCVQPTKKKKSILATRSWVRSWRQQLARGGPDFFPQDPLAALQGGLLRCSHTRDISPVCPGSDPEYFLMEASAHLYLFTFELLHMLIFWTSAHLLNPGLSLPLERL